MCSPIVACLIIIPLRSHASRMERRPQCDLTHTDCVASRMVLYAQGFYPFVRTVELRVFALLAGMPVSVAAGDCGSARYSQRYPLSPRLSSGTADDSRAPV